MSRFNFQISKFITALAVAAALMTFIFAGEARARESGYVAATIAPLHSLVDNVIKGTGEAFLVVPAQISPHQFSLKPSDIGKMTGAEAVFFIGEDFETFLASSLRSLPQEVARIPVAEKSGVALLKNKTAVHGGHSHGIYDLHIWLSPGNAEKMVIAIAKELSKLNPRKRNAYKRNARETISKLKKLDAKISAELEGLQEVPYAVFHEAYRYFERHYGMNQIGAITQNPEMAHSAGSVKRIREKIMSSGAVCVFGEPQFGEKIVLTAIEGTGAKAGFLDPIGFGIKPGAELYFTLMENLAKSLKNCLAR